MTEFSFNSFQMSFLVGRLVTLTEVKDDVVDNCVLKLIIDKYGENVLFSYPNDRSTSSLAFMSSIHLVDVIVRSMAINNKIVKRTKEVRKKLLRKELNSSHYYVRNIN